MGFEGRAWDIRGSRSVEGQGGTGAGYSPQLLQTAHNEGVQVQEVYQYPFMLEEIRELPGVPGHLGEGIPRSSDAALEFVDNPCPCRLEQGTCCVNSLPRMTCWRVGQTQVCFAGCVVPHAFYATH